MESQTSITEKGIGELDQKVLFSYMGKFQELTRWDTCVECIGGCGAGGALYFLLFAAGSLWFRTWRLELLLLLPFLILFQIFFGFLAGLISGAIASLIVMPFNASLGWPLKSLWCSFIVGGLAGFLPFLILLIMAPLFMVRPNDTELMFIAAVGPIPAMALGHVCAYWNTKSVVQDHNARFGVVQHDAVQPDVRDSRFTITHIMIVTIWVAVGFSLFSAFAPKFQMQMAKFYFLSQSVAGLLAIILIKVVSCVQTYRKRNVSTPNH